jgi:hypothetical protein
MKKLLPLIFLLCGMSWGEPALYPKGTAAYQPTYVLLDSTGTAVTDQTITLQIMLKGGEEYFYDFSDQTFKTSGWTTKTTNLTYNSNLKAYILETDFIPNTGTAFNTEFTYYFIYDNSNSTYKDHQVEEIVFHDFTSEVSVDTSGLASAVWNYSISDITMPGYAGAYLKDMLTPSMVWNYAINDITMPGYAGKYLNSQVGGATPQEIWNYAINDINQSGYAGTYLNSIGNNSAAAFWNYLLTNSTVPNSAGKILSDLKKRNY